MSIFDTLMSLSSGDEVDYTRNVGKVTIAWNDLHTSAYYWFLRLLNKPGAPTKALWECAGSDGRQRQMLKAISGLINQNDVKDELLWCLDISQKLSEYRNSLIHSPVMLDGKTYEYKIIKFATKDAHIKRFNDLKEKKLYKALIHDMDEIKFFMLNLADYYFGEDDSKTLPDRPQLQAYPELFQEPNLKATPSNPKEPDPLPIISGVISITGLSLLLTVPRL